MELLEWIRESISGFHRLHLPLMTKVRVRSKDIPGPHSGSQQFMVLDRCRASNRIHLPYVGAEHLFGLKRWHRRFSLRFVRMQYEWRWDADWIFFSSICPIYRSILPILTFRMPYEMKDSSMHDIPAEVVAKVDSLQIQNHGPRANNIWLG